MLVPQRLRNTVVFLGQREATEIRVGGTAFFVSVPYATLPEYRFVYLVTARHAVDGKTGLVARINRPAGMTITTDERDQVDLSKAGTFNLDLPDGDDDLWLTHPNPNPGEDYVDIAAVRVHDFAAMVAHSAGYGWVPMSMFFPESLLGDEPDSGVGIGDEVVTLGLLTVHYGQEKNEAVMRMGNLAMVPDEPVLVKYRTGPNRRMRLYLTELRSISGLSGSPVFIRHRTFPGDLELPPMSLLGLMIGHWDDPNGNHMGFGKVVPAALIAEVLNQEKEMKKREKEEMGKEAGGTAHADSALEEDEYQRFDDLARKLVNTPKSEEPPKK